METLRIQVYAPEPPDDTQAKSLYYSWKSKEPGKFSIRTQGFDSEQVYMSSPEAKRLMPMSHEVSTYIQGLGVIPTPTEAAVLENLRAIRQGEVQEMQSKRDAILLSIKAMCQDLLVTEVPLQEKLKELAVVSSILAPIRRLPLELLTNIFRLTTAEPQRPYRNNYPSMVLCRVCSLWRNIAIKDPLLWTRIRFTYPVYNEFIQSEEYCNSDEEELTPSRDESEVIEEYQRMLRRVQVFVQRAGSAPLSLSVDDYPTDEIRIDTPSPMLRAYRQTALKMLVSLFPRCRSLNFYVDHAWGMSLFTKLPPDAFSKLENLEIGFHQEMTASSPTETRLFTLSPLRHYRLSSEFPRDLAHISVPHSSLEKLTLLLSDRAHTNTNLPCADAVEMWRSFLLKCRNLRDAYVSYLAKQFPIHPTLPDAIIWASVPPGSRAPLVHLSKFHVRTNLHASACVMLRGLDFPALNSLCLESLHAIGPAGGEFSLVPEGNALKDTVLQDMPYVTRLTTLSLIRVSVENVDLYSLLHIVTQLEVLNILRGAIQTSNDPARSMTETWLEDSAGLISFLTVDKNRQKEDTVLPPLPHLQTVVLYHGINTLGDRAADVAYAQLAHSRYEWMLQHFGRHDLHSTEEVMFDKSPFRIAVYKPEELGLPLSKLNLKEDLKPAMKEIQERDLHALSMVTDLYHKPHEAADVEEFKRIFLDCLECHYHTYTTGRVLHRDISENNLMFADPKEVAAPTGVTDWPSSRWGILNDFDLGSEVDEDGNVQSSNANHRTGTLPYMAIDLVRPPLKPSPRIEYVPPAHYYRHDLESFFYILIFASTRYTFEKGKCLPVPACLRTWQDDATASDSKNAFFGYRGAEAVKVAVLDHFLPLWDEWIAPLYIMFKTAFNTIPEPGFPAFKTYDMVTLNNRITFEAFMATIKVIPRNSAGGRTK